MKKFLASFLSVLMVLTCIIIPGMTLSASATVNNDASQTSIEYIVDGEVVKTETVEKGTEYTISYIHPHTAEKRFAGWYYDEALTEKVAHNTTSVSTDGIDKLCFYAKMVKYETKVTMPINNSSWGIGYYPYVNANGAYILNISTKRNSSSGFLTADADKLSLVANAYRTFVIVVKNPENGDLLVAKTGAEYKLTIKYKVNKTVEDGSLRLCAGYDIAEGGTVGGANAFAYSSSEGLVTDTNVSSEIIELSQNIIVDERSGGYPFMGFRVIASAGFEADFYELKVEEVLGEDISTEYITYISDKTLPTDLGKNHFIGTEVAVCETGKLYYEGNNIERWKLVTETNEASPAAQVFYGAKSSTTILKEADNTVGQTEYYLQMTVVLSAPVKNPTTFHFATNLAAASNAQLPDYYEIFASDKLSDLYKTENSCGIISTTGAATRQHKVNLSGYDLPEVKYFGVRFYHRPYSNWGVQISSMGLYGGEVITRKVKGDVDGDRDCDTSDLASLKLILAGNNAEDTDSYNSDVNGDGISNTTDLAEMKLMLSTLPVYEDSLKILAIGNSFSVDAMQHLYGIMADGGLKNIVLGNLYIGGCSITTHVSNLDTHAKDYDYRKNTNGKWVSNAEYSANDALVDEEWDIISIQQSSGHSGKAYTYEKLGALIDHIKAVQPNAKIVWHMTWAYAQDSVSSNFPRYDSDQMTMYNSIVNCVQDVIIPNENISKIMPVGTAIQNLRTSYLGDTLNRDGNHLSAGIGRYTAALTWYAVLTGRSIDDISYIPVDYPEVEENLPAIKDAVKKAISKPFDITESAYK